MNAIDCRAISVNYTKTCALNHIDLTLQPGQCVAVLGLNGAGKTTLFKAILNLVHLNSGSIHINTIPHRRPHARTAISYLPDRFAPPNYMTGAAYIKCMAGLYGLSYEEKAAKAAAINVALDAAALHIPIRRYSKGMTQKLGLCSVLLSQKDIYLLDEPMSGLDPQARAAIKQQLWCLKDSGKTLLFSSHLLADIDPLVDRIMILHQSKIAFFGAPAQCMALYQQADLEQAFNRCIKATD